MYRGKQIIQVGSHIGDTVNDPIFQQIDETTRMILVEPVPFLFSKLQANYRSKLSDTTNIIFINKAVSDIVGEIELTIPSERNDFSKLPFWASQLASVNPHHVSVHLSSLETDKIKVPTTTIDEIITEYNIEEIDLLHTDTEGHDYNILMNYSFNVKPKKVLFENKHMDGIFKRGPRYVEVSRKLLDLGYIKQYENAEDTMFVLP